MKHIPLTQGQFAIVDDEDYQRLNKFKWFAKKVPSGGFYAERNCSIPNSKKRNTNYKMHRFLMGDPEGFEVDHRNGNKLDNRKSNLRIATRSQNQQNSVARRDNKSGFKGVGWHKASGRWVARIRENGRRLHLGVFETPEDASVAYLAAASRVQGEFMCQR